MAMDADHYQRTERTRVRRLPERAAYDRATVHAILDEGFICHVGFVVDGQPFVVPTGYARVGETVYLHGSTGSRLGLRPGMDVCVTVTLVDGLVLARSAFHPSNDGLQHSQGRPRDRRIPTNQANEAAPAARASRVRPGDGPRHPG
jgi:Pyridoxamine 5'-phosphate oxidase